MVCWLGRVPWLSSGKATGSQANTEGETQHSRWSFYEVVNYNLVYLQTLRQPRFIVQSQIATPTAIVISRNSDGIL